ncbi:MAG: hypothetical protein JXB45_06445 [Candidatus Krumholzibacteriota bacterium]|nr:hypothetical protein [Candidatus Krumholzibacteriota bacterium]
MTGKKFLWSALVLILVLSGCKAVNTTVDVIKKDIPVEDMDGLKDEYIGKKAWNRSLLADIGGNGVLDRGTEVIIVELDMHWTGAVGVKGPNRRKIRHTLNLERPVTKETYVQALNRLFWYDKPDKRYRMNLRKFGKRTARAIRDNELFKGMVREAALESWGFPDETSVSEIGEYKDEQLIYRDPRLRTKKRYIILRDGLVESWVE